MIEDSFYITLLSNSSVSYFPNNTTANFSTKLPKSIKLVGEWVVGIAEFHYPCTMLNVQEHDNVIYVTKRTKIQEGPVNSQSTTNAAIATVEYKTHIPATTYDNVDQLLEAINSNQLIKGHATFRYDKISKLVCITKTGVDVASIKASEKLSLQLGFEPFANFLFQRYGKYPVNLYLGLPSQLFIYCDIIEPQIVGDVMTSLIRIIPLDPTKYIYGAYKMHTFSPPHYLPVLKREFDTIEIDIRTDTGKKIPFQFGTSCVKLHFKRITL